MLQIMFSVTEVNSKVSIPRKRNRENIFTCLSFVLRGHKTNMFFKALKLTKYDKVEANSQVYYST